MKKELIRSTDILGDWIGETQDIKIQIYESPYTGFFNGKITWIIEDDSRPNNPALDTLNPDESLNKRTIVGMDFVTGLSFNPRNKEWKNGKIYNPREGKTYNLKVWLLDKNTLNFRGYMDSIGLLGRNLEWCRLEHC